MKAEGEQIKKALSGLISSIFESDNFTVEVFHSPLYGFKAWITSEDRDLLRFIIGKGGRNIYSLKMVFGLFTSRHQMHVEIFASGPRDAYYDAKSGRFANAHGDKKYRTNYNPLQREYSSHGEFHSDRNDEREAQPDGLGNSAPQSE